MIRSGTSPTGPVAALAFCFRDTKEGDHALQWMVREPAADGEGKAFHAQGGIAVRQSPPLWLKLTRLGSNFAVSKSPDGKLWSPLGNTSGSQFAAEGPLEVGYRRVRRDSDRLAAARPSHELGGQFVRWEPV